MTTHPKLDHDARSLFFSRVFHHRQLLRDAPVAITFATGLIHEEIRKAESGESKWNGNRIGNLATLIEQASERLYDKVAWFAGEDDDAMLAEYAPPESEPKEPPTPESVRRDADHFAELAKIFERRAKEMEELEGGQ